MLSELSSLRLLEPGSRFVTALGEQRRPMTGLNELREQGKMTWIEQERGWVAASEEIVNQQRDYRSDGARHKSRFSPSG
jgi:hypothetical protein